MLPEPPANGGYMVAAYIAAPVILVGYLLTLWRRARRALGRDPEHTVVARTAG